jgi:uncharacterized RDD family membrane protein YckC
MQGNDQVGPISEEQFQELLNSGAITAETYVWRDGMPDWKRYKNLEVQASSVAVAGDARYCAECGNRFPTEELLRFGESFVCASCKPVFLQRMREGAPIPAAMNYGGFWIRVGAKLIDNIILSIVNGIIQAMGSAALVPAMNPDEPPGPIFFVVMAVMTLLQLAVAATYTTWFVGKFAATPGKMVCKLKVVMSDGGQVSYLRAFGRYFAEMLSGCILLIGYIMAAFDDEKRTLHDRICDTRVIYKQ